MDLVQHIGGAHDRINETDIGVSSVSTSEMDDLAISGNRGASVLCDGA